MLTLGLDKGLELYADTERGLLRLQGAFAQIGDSSSDAAQSVLEFAEKAQQVTFFKKDDFLQAAAELTTFKGVSEDAIEPILGLSADLAERFGTDVPSAARILGKAFDDPVNGMERMTRYGIALSDSEKEQYTALILAGDAAEAKRLLLVKLTDQMGGAAEAAASGYAGSIDHLKKSYDELLESLGKIIAAGGYVANIFNSISQSINGAADFIGDPQKRLEQQIESIQESIDNANQTGLADTPGYSFLQNELKGYQGQLEDYKATLIDNADIEDEWNEELNDTNEQIAENVTQNNVYSGSLDKLKGSLKDTKDALQDYLDSLGDKQYLATLDPRQSKIDEAEIHAENLALQQGVELTEQQYQYIDDTVGATYDQEEATKALQKAEQDRLEAYKKQTDALAEPFIKAGEQAQSSLASAFDKILTTGKLTWQDLGNSFKESMLKAISDVAAAMVFKATIAPILIGAAGAIGGSDVADATANKFGLGSNATSGLSSISSIGNLFNTTAGGFNTVNTFGADYLGTGLPGLEGALTATSLTSILSGAGIGALGGGLLTNLLGENSTGGSIGGGLGGAIGTAIAPGIGTAVGSVLGSVVGGLFGGGVHHVASSFDGTITDAGLNVADYKADNTDTQAVQALAAQVNTYIQQLTAAGIHASNQQLTASLDSGNGYFSLNGQKFAFDPSDANSVNAALDDVFKQILTGANIADKDLAAAIQKANTAGKTFAEVMSEVTFQLQTLPALQQQAYSSAISNINSQISLLQDQATTYSQTQSKWQSYSDSLKSTLESLLTDTTLSTLSPADQLAASRANFETISSKAQGGDETAIGELSDAGKQLLTASKDYYASSAQYNDDFQLVSNAIQNVASYSDSQTDEQQRLLSGVQSQITIQQNQETLLQGILDTLNKKTATGPWSQVPDSALLFPGESADDLNKLNTTNNLTERVVREIKTLAGYDFNTMNSSFIAFAKQNPQAGVLFNNLVTQAGGTTQQFATGGLVTGGIAGKDSVRALLTPGEYVMTPQAVSKYGISAFDSLNYGGSGSANDNSMIAELRAIRMAVNSLTKVSAAGGDANISGLASLDARLAAIESKTRLSAAA